MSDIASRWLDHKKRLRPCPFSVLPEMAVRPKYVVHESDIDELVLQITALRAEIERLRAGGCARDQMTTQYCAEAARLAAENERLRAMVVEAAQLSAENAQLRAERLTETLQSDVSRLAAENERLRAALEWYGEQARLCRLIHSEGDAGRKALADDGGLRARAALQDKSDE